MRDPFGRSAFFTYNEAGQLVAITDMIGMTSRFTYGTGIKADFINSMTTPYGTTRFDYGDSSTDRAYGTGERGGAGFNRWITTQDMEGGQERFEYTEGVAPEDTSKSGDGKSPSFLRSQW